MHTIAIDVMGIDKGPAPIIAAAKDFLQQHLDYKVIFVGDREVIEKHTKESEKVRILHAAKFIRPDEEIFASRDKQTSMYKAIELVKNREADVVLSAGHSGAYLANSTIILRRIPGIKRPSFLSVLPTLTPNKNIVMLDCGANKEASGEVIAQWAYLARNFVETVFGNKKPIVGMINIGTEKSKGLKFHAEANAILQKDHSLNYVGFIEPRSILNGNVDVILTDGYGGNLILKTMEGTVLAMVKLLRQNLTKKFSRKVLALMLRKGLRETMERFDYRNVGAACVIGVDGLVIKCHGSSDKKAFVGAFRQLHIAIQKELIQKLRKYA